MKERKAANPASWSNYMRKCLRLGRSFLGKRHIHCNLQITYQCNFQCEICDFWKEEYQHQQELSLSDIRTISAKLAQLGTFIVSLAGGEPLLRRDLFQIIAILAADHFPILITNGWHVNPQNAGELFRSGLQEISVSLDYATPERHDAMRGCPGAYERAVSALRLLKKSRPLRTNRVHMITVLMDDNVDEIERLILLAREIGVTYMVNLYSYNRGKKEERLPKKEISSYLLGLRKKHPNFISLTGYLKRFDEAVACGGIGDCLAGRLYLNIDNRGNVARCTETTDEPVGSILGEEISAISEKLRRQNREGECSLCWTSCRGFAESMYRGNRLKNWLEFFNTIRPY